MEVNVKRELLTRIVLVIVGLMNLAVIYFLYTYSGRGLSTRGREETI